MVGPENFSKQLPDGQSIDSQMSTNGQLRLGQGSIGKDSLSKDKLDKDNIGKDSSSKNNITSEIMTEEQLLQAVYISQIKDRNANNIIECVSYLKYLPIEVIKIALEQTSLQQIPEWKYARDILDNWIKKGISSIDDIKNNFEKISENSNVNITETGGFKRKGDEILNG